MAGIFGEKCREKEKYREEQIGECPFSIPRYNVKVSILNNYGDIFDGKSEEKEKRINIGKNK